MSQNTNSSLSTTKLCSATTGLLSWLEKTVVLHLYLPRLASWRLGRRKTASAELTPMSEASWVPDGLSSTVWTVAERLAGTATMH